MRSRATHERTEKERKAQDKGRSEASFPKSRGGCLGEIGQSGEEYGLQKQNGSIQGDRRWESQCGQNDGGVLGSQIEQTRSLIDFHSGILEQLAQQLAQLELLAQQVEQGSGEAAEQSTEAEETEEEE